MPKLFSYCIPHDTGAAPNPFWGTCTLVICKPAIRRAAQVGDWVVGTGSVNSPIGDIGGRLVYAMKVTAVMTMQEYDDYTRRKLRGKIPRWNSSDYRLPVGDSIYDFSKNPPSLRKSVHGIENRSRDLRGRNALISKHFFYFGDQPVKLPHRLKPLSHRGQGHRSKSNEPFFLEFVRWIHSLGYRPNSVLGRPQRAMLSDETDKDGLEMSPRSMNPVTAIGKRSQIRSTHLLSVNWCEAARRGKPGHDMLKCTLSED